jgi:type IV pilus assembly protein PilE
MAIVGILMAVAVPTYREQMRKSARADAQSFLTGVAARQQQYLVDKRRYAASLDALGMATPSSVAGRFADPLTIEVPNAVPPTFRLVATAIGDQAYDKCPTLSIDSAGNRQPANCW